MLYNLYKLDFLERSDNMIPFIVAALGTALGTTTCVAGAAIGSAVSGMSTITKTLIKWEDVKEKLNIAEVAALIGVSTYTIRRKVTAGELHPEKTSNKTGLVFDKLDVEEYAKKNNINLNLSKYSALKNAKTTDDTIVPPDVFSVQLAAISEQEEKPLDLLRIIKDGLDSESDGIQACINNLKASVSGEPKSEHKIKLSFLEALLANKKRDIALCSLYILEAEKNNNDINIKHSE